MAEHVSSGRQLGSGSPGRALPAGGCRWLAFDRVEIGLLDVATALARGVNGVALAGLLLISTTVSAGDGVGRQLFEGSHPALRLTTTHRDRQVAVPPEQAACTACHRPSGLGSFEGGSVVPPISSGLLAQPYDPATTRRYAPSGQMRVRPAYDSSGLHRLLVDGLTPDGLQVGGLMPRYALTQEQSKALLNYLNELGTSPTPGVDDQQVHFATITTDDTDTVRQRDLLGVMRTFLVHKNASTRSETARRASAERNQQSMYRRHRQWILHHWHLTGPPSGWPEQLAMAYSRQPVFAVLSGTSPHDWLPVHRFCEAQRMPCLFPVTPLPGPEGGFYAAYFSAGLPAQARELAREVSEQEPAARAQDFLVLTGDDAATQTQGEHVAAALRLAGLRARTAARWQGEPWVVSALTPSQLASRLPPPSQPLPGRLVLLAGASPAQVGHAALTPWRGLLPMRWITQQASGTVPLARARAWWRGKAYQPQDEAFAAQVLFALQTAVESLVHVDERFSREYCLEKLEHNLENMPPLTAYPRLSLGPAQRVAARSVWIEQEP